MKIIDRLKAALTPTSFNHMCIRCDERKPDVPYAGARCSTCHDIVTQIAAEHPDAYEDFVRRFEAHGLHVPMIGER